MLSKTIDPKFIYGLPKAELHVHLEGTLEPELKLALAQKNHIDIGQTTVEDIRKTYEFNSSLSAFLAVYYSGMIVLQTEDDFYQLAMEYLKRAKENNVRHVEMFFDPQAHLARGISFDTVINGYYQACQDAKALNIDAQLIMCFLRDMPAQSANEILLMPQHHRNKILGIGLDSDEHHNPPLKFAYQFANATAQGYHTTMHADIDQIDSIEHIKQALEIINVNRLDHGTNIVENQDLVKWAAHTQIGLTACPLSNKFIANDSKGKEILDLLDQGVKVSINSDDPAYFGGYISDNYLALDSEFEISKEDIIKLAKNSFETSWISPIQKQIYLNEIDTYVNNYEE
ncbi:adenosine deaminase [Companilactobacillus kedongensis]|uniref:adenosine deaminase n=1 Tax=Companilactobacillus kedongensis TaxID=2486004 RepID=UPI0013DDA6A2|nr:adenosine deaminase [Companilactobacillus kedongensis]